MKVRFARDVLEDENVWRILDRIVDHFLDQRHLWDINDPALITSSRWIQDAGRAGSANLEAMQKCYTQAIYHTPGTHMHTNTLTITYQGNTLSELPPDEARRCLDTPAYVVLEDAQSDGAFLEAMIYALKRRALSDAQTERWWEIRHAGGSGRLPTIVDQIRVQTAGPLRVFVLSDSDRLFPGHEPQTARQIRDYCTKNNVPHAILTKREMESYLPVNLLQRVPRQRQHIYRAFLRLNRQQQDYYDMKSGFQQDAQGQPTIPPEQDALYQHVPPSVRRDLCGGFGRNAWQYFTSGRDHLTEDSIRLTCPDDPGEIKRILDTIESLL